MLNENEQSDTRRVFIASLPNGAFGNAGQSWKTLDLNIIGNSIAELGLKIVFTCIDKLETTEFTTDDIIIYTSSDEPSIRTYLRDTLFFIAKKCVLLPRYELLLAHENKGFQEVHKRELGIGNLEGFYHYDLDAYDGEYPFVYKRPAGAGGSSVSLIRDAKDKSRIRKQDFPVGFRRKVIICQRRYKLSASCFSMYQYRHKGFRTHVCQVFINNLDCDYKVLVFDDRFFVLKRFVRNNDFKASGSGNFDFTAEPPEKVLQFAANVFDRMDVPFISLDIALSSAGCHLIEYQALDFGVTTLTKSVFHFKRDDTKWKKIDGTSDLNENYGYALMKHIDRLVTNSPVRK